MEIQNRCNTFEYHEIRENQIICSIIACQTEKRVNKGKSHFRCTKKMSIECTFSWKRWLSVRQSRRLFHSIAFIISGNNVEHVLNVIFGFSPSLTQCNKSKAFDSTNKFKIQWLTLIACKPNGNALPPFHPKDFVYAPINSLEDEFWIVSLHSQQTVESVTKMQGIKQDNDFNSIFHA